MKNDHVIWRRDLQELMHVTSNTVRRWMKVRSLLDADLGEDSCRNAVRAKYGVNLSVVI